MCAYMCMCACVWTGDECVMNQVRGVCGCITSMRSTYICAMLYIGIRYPLWGGIDEVHYTCVHTYVYTVHMYTIVC